MLIPMSSMVEVQANLTTETETITKFLNYSASHPYAVTEYRRSGMILHIYSDASYMSETEARSRAGMYFFLRPKSSNNRPKTAMPP